MSDLRDDITKAYKEIEERKNAPPYDGINGELPNFPENFQMEFRGIRNRLLLLDYELADLLRYIDEYVRMLDSKEAESFRPGTPPDIAEDILILAGFKKADRICREEGIGVAIAYLTQDKEFGKDAESGSKFRAAQLKKSRIIRGVTEYKGTAFTVNGIIKNLVTKPEHELYNSRDLWDEFYNELDRYELYPQRETHANGDKSYIEYDFYIKEKYSRKKKTYKTFRNDVSRFRKKKSK
jgi:hypothetical protein